MRKEKKRRVSAKHQIEIQTLKTHEREFHGKNVIVVGRQIFPVESGKQAAKLLAELREKYPDQTPLLAYAMGEETYILCL
ncbi:MAG: hypothetical protein HY741_02965 [Chloroflexi bacterium]|nr:hypothetical protein [Chloroflexota bacterium]